MCVCSHLEQLKDKVKRFRFLHQLVQVFVAEAVVGEHVGHATGVDVPVHRIFAFRNAPHAFRHDRIDTSVLQETEFNRRHILNPNQFNYLIV